MTKREAFVTMMTVLGESFNRVLTSGVLEGYWMACEDLTEEEMQTATKRVMKASKFMPVASELLAYIREDKKEREQFARLAASVRQMERIERETRMIAERRPTADELAGLRTRNVSALVEDLAETKTLPVETAAQIQERENAARAKVAAQLAAWQERNPS